MDAAARAVDPRIASVRVVYQDEVRDLLIGTSDGAFILDRQYLLSATCAPRGRGERAAARVRRPRRARRRGVPDPRASRRRGAQGGASGDHPARGGTRPAGPMPVVIAPGWAACWCTSRWGTPRRATACGAARRSSREARERDRLAAPASWTTAGGERPRLGDRRRRGDSGAAHDPGRGGGLVSYLLDKQNALLLGPALPGTAAHVLPPASDPAHDNTYIDRGTDDPASLLEGITKGRSTPPTWRRLRGHDERQLQLRRARGVLDREREDHALRAERGADRELARDDAADRGRRNRPGGGPGARPLRQGWAAGPGRGGAARRCAFRRSRSAGRRSSDALVRAAS